MNQKEKIKLLKEKSQWLRSELFTMMWGNGKRGLIPSCYSCIEIVIALHYGGIIRDDPKKPKWKNRDTLILSKGHAASVVFPILADKGFFPKEEILKYASKGGILTPYAMHNVPGIESITGSLGHGFGIAAGEAYAARVDGLDAISYVIIGDGECHEGSIWENANFAAHHKLDNLVTFVDRNKLCTMGMVDDIMGIEPLEDKWNSFGWFTQRIDGHSFPDILNAINNISVIRRKQKKGGFGKPAVIIADTIKGKGISFMENRAEWHNKKPSEKQIAQALIDLKIDHTIG